MTTRNTYERPELVIEEISTVGFLCLSYTAESDPWVSVEGTVSSSNVLSFDNVDDPNGYE